MGIQATQRRAAVRALVTVAACALAALAASPTAQAHAFLERSEPSDGSVLREPPRTIRLWFSEDVVVKLSATRLLDGIGRPVAGADLEPDSSKPGLLSVAVPKLRRGVYSLQWTVLSEEDSHLRKGGLVFRVGAGMAPAPSGTREESPLTTLDVALRWTNLALLAALVGALGVAGLVLGRLEGRERDRELADAAGRARRRVLGWAIWCAGLSLVVGVGLLAFQAAALARDLPGDGGFAEIGGQLLTDSRWGRLWLERELILLALLGVLLLNRRGLVAGKRGSALPAATLAVALVVVHALGGHAAAAPDPALMVLVATLHLLAAGLWVGGLLALLVGLWPQLGLHTSQSVALARASLRPFGSLAALSVGLLVATGLFYAGRQVASLDALVTTLYGQALMAKTALILGVGAVGSTNAMLLHPRLAAPLRWLLGRPAGWTPISPSRLRTLVVAEAGLGLVVVAAAGVLTAAAPARGPEFAPGREAAPSLLSQTVGDLLVTVSVKPGLPGPNVFEVLAISTRRPPPADVERVSLRFTDPNGERDASLASMREIEQGRYRLGGDFVSGPGTWRLEAVIDRTGLERSVAGFDWPVTIASPRRPVLISDRPLESILTRVSVAAFLVLAVAFCLLVFARLAPAGPRLARRSRSLRRAGASPPPP
jgi:copper transport protein